MISSITKDIIYVGVNDHDVDLFEGQYIVPNGMSYNSYVIMDERIAVMDTVDAHFGEEWLSNVKEALTDASRTILWCSIWSRIIRQTWQTLLPHIPMPR